MISHAGFPVDLIKKTGFETSDQALSTWEITKEMKTIEGHVGSDSAKTHSHIM